MEDKDLFCQAVELSEKGDYDKAIKLYTEAIAADDSQDKYYSSRSDAYIKLQKYADALADASKAVALNPQNVQAYCFVGIANFHLKNFESAKGSFLQGQKMDPSNKDFSEWIEKCDTEINSTDKTEAEKKPEMGNTLSQPDVPSGATAASADTQPSETPPVPTMPSGPKTRYEWYQTETHVVVTVLMKKVKKENCAVDIQENTLSVTIKMSSGSDYSLELDIAHPVVPAQSFFKVLSTKVEIKLKKVEGIRWTTLEADGPQSKVKHFDSVAAATNIHAYPTSSHCMKDWDKVVADIKAEEKDEKLEGDAALNKLFQQIYSDSTEDVKRAMNKSFVESSGTVLSTNWKEVGEKEVERKPPDGMEFKKWNT